MSSSQDTSVYNRTSCLKVMTPQLGTREVLLSSLERDELRGKKYLSTQ